MVSFHHGGADADGGGATSVYTRRDVTTPVLEIHFEARAQLDHMRTLNIRLLEDRVLQNFAELLGWEDTAGGDADADRGIADDRGSRQP